MSDERMEVIVVGGGLAGLSAAYTMARAAWRCFSLSVGATAGRRT